MAKSKKKIDSFKFRALVKKEYDSTKVSVPLGDLELLIKAAKKTVKFYVAHDNYIGGGLAVDAQQMADAYKRINSNKAIKAAQAQAKEDSANKVLDKYEVDDGS